MDKRTTPNGYGIIAKERELVCQTEDVEALYKEIDLEILHLASETSPEAFRQSFTHVAERKDFRNHKTLWLAIFYKTTKHDVYEKIFEKVFRQDCEGLRDKPIVMLAIAEENVQDTEDNIKDSVISTDIDTNLIILYSTITKNSKRPWVPYSLLKAIQEYGDTHHLRQLIAMVMNDVAIARYQLLKDGFPAKEYLQKGDYKITVENNLNVKTFDEMVNDCNTNSSILTGEGRRNLLKDLFQEENLPAYRTFESQISERGTLSVQDALQLRSKLGEKAYPMSKNPRGLGIIINESSGRNSSFVDVHRMSSLFKNLHFDIHLVLDKTHDEINNEMIRILQLVSAQDQCFVLILMAHGTTDSNVHSFSDVLSKKATSGYIADRLQKTKHLTKLPKIVILQTCLGDKDMISSLLGSMETDALPNTGELSILNVQLEEFVLISPSRQGYKVYRDSVRGAHLIQSLENTIRKECKEHSLAALLSETHRETNPSSSKFAQKPETKFNLTRQLYFYPGLVEDDDSCECVGKGYWLKPKDDDLKPSEESLNCGLFEWLEQYQNEVTGMTKPESEYPYIGAEVILKQEERSYMEDDCGEVHMVVKDTIHSVMDPNSVAIMDNLLNLNHDGVNRGRVDLKTVLRNTVCRARKRERYTKLGSKIMIFANTHDQQDKNDDYSVQDHTMFKTFVEAAVENNKTGNITFIFNGESGAGKTVHAGLAIEYLCKKNKAPSDKTKILMHANTIFEAFGNAKTSINRNSSRHQRMTSFWFDEMGRLIKANIDAVLPEKGRIPEPLSGEGNYHVFYRMIAGLDLQRKQQLGLGFTSNPVQMETFPMLPENKFEQCPKKFKSLETALKGCGVKVDDVWKILACIIHLQRIVFQQEDDGRICIDVKSEDSLKYLSEILRWSSLQRRETSDDCRHRIRKLLLQPTSRLEHKAYTKEALKTNVDSICKNIYEKLFLYISDTVNESMGGKVSMNCTHRQICALDIYGFESLKENCYEQLFINLANEKLQDSLYKVLIYEVLYGTVSGTRPSQCRSNSKVLPIQQLLEDLNNSRLLGQKNDTEVMNTLLRHPSFQPKGLEITVDHYAGQVVYNMKGFYERTCTDMNNEALYGMFGKFDILKIDKGTTTTQQTYWSEFKKHFKKVEAALDNENCDLYSVLCLALPGKEWKQKRLQCLKQIKNIGVPNFVNAIKEGFIHKLPFHRFASEFYILMKKQYGENQTLQIQGVLENAGIKSYKSENEFVFLKDKDYLKLKSSEHKLSKAQDRERKAREQEKQEMEKRKTAESMKRAEDKREKRGKEEKKRNEIDERDIRKKEENEKRKSIGGDMRQIEISEKHDKDEVKKKREITEDVKGGRREITKSIIDKKGKSDSAERKKDVVVAKKKSDGDNHDVQKQELLEKEEPAKSEIVAEMNFENREKETHENEEAKRDVGDSVMLRDSEIDDSRVKFEEYIREEHMVDEEKWKNSVGKQKKITPFKYRPGRSSVFNETVRWKQLSRNYFNEQTSEEARVKNAMQMIFLMKKDKNVSKKDNQYRNHFLEEIAKNGDSARKLLLICIRSCLTKDEATKFIEWMPSAERTNPIYKCTWPSEFYAKRKHPLTYLEYKSIMATDEGQLDFIPMEITIMTSFGPVSVQIQPITRVKDVIEYICQRYNIAGHYLQSFELQLQVHSSTEVKRILSNEEFILDELYHELFNIDWYGIRFEFSMFLPWYIAGDCPNMDRILRKVIQPGQGQNRGHDMKKLLMKAKFNHKYSRIIPATSPDHLNWPRQTAYLEISVHGVRSINREEYVIKTIGFSEIMKVSLEHDNNDSFLRIWTITKEHCTLCHHYQVDQPNTILRLMECILDKLAKRSVFAVVKEPNSLLKGPVVTFKPNSGLGEHIDVAEVDNGNPNETLKIDRRQLHVLPTQSLPCDSIRTLLKDAQFSFEFQKSVPQRKHLTIKLSQKERLTQQRPQNRLSQMFTTLTKTLSTIGNKEAQRKLAFTNFLLNDQHAITIRIVAKIYELGRNPDGPVAAAQGLSGHMVTDIYEDILHQIQEKSTENPARLWRILFIVSGMFSPQSDEFRMQVYKFINTRWDSLQRLQDLNMLPFCGEGICCRIDKTQKCGPRNSSPMQMEIDWVDKIRLRTHIKLQVNVCRKSTDFYDLDSTSTGYDVKSLIDEINDMKDQISGRGIEWHQCGTATISVNFHDKGEQCYRVLVKDDEYVFDAVKKLCNAHKNDTSLKEVQHITANDIYLSLELETRHMNIDWEKMYAFYERGSSIDNTREDIKMSDADVMLYFDGVEKQMQEIEQYGQSRYKDLFSEIRNRFAEVLYSVEHCRGALKWLKKLSTDRNRPLDFSLIESTVFPCKVTRRKKAKEAILVINLSEIEFILRKDYDSRMRIQYSNIETVECRLKDNLVIITSGGELYHLKVIQAQLVYDTIEAYRHVFSHN